MDDVVRAEADGFGSAWSVHFSRGVDALNILAVAIAGNEADIDQQIGRLSDVGVTELWPIVFPVGDDAADSRRQSRALLAELAAATRPR